MLDKHHVCIPKDKLGSYLLNACMSAVTLCYLKPGHDHILLQIVSNNVTLFLVFCLTRWEEQGYLRSLEICSSVLCQANIRAVCNNPNHLKTNHNSKRRNSAVATFARFKRDTYCIWANGTDEPSELGKDHRNKGNILFRLILPSKRQKMLNYNYEYVRFIFREHA